MCSNQYDGRVLEPNGHVHEVAVKVCEAKLCPKTVHDDVDGSIMEQHRVGLLVHLLQNTTGRDVTHNLKATVVCMKENDVTHLASEVCDGHLQRTIHWDAAHLIMVNSPNI